MKPKVHLWSYLAIFFSDLQMLNTNLYRISKHTFKVKWTFLIENQAFCEIMWRKKLYSRTGHRRLWHMPIGYWIRETKTHTQNVQYLQVFHCKQKL